MDKKSLVIGDGGWGMAIALSLHRAGRSVSVWGFDPAYTAEVARLRENPKFLPGVHIPEDVLWTSDVNEALEGVEEIYSVVPTQFLRGVAQRFEEFLRRSSKARSMNCRFSLLPKVWNFPP